MAISHAFTNPVANATGTLTVWYGATTATVAATDIVRPDDWNSAHYQYMSVTGNTVGQSTFSGTNIVIGGGPNITISGVNATRFDISAGAGGAGDGGVGISAGANSVSTGTVVFSNSNGISFGLNGSTVTAQHNALTTARASNDAIGLATAQSNVTWTVNSAGLSLDARGYAGTGTTFNGASLSGSMTVNSNGVQLSLSAGPYLTTAALSNHSHGASAANGSFGFQTLSFSNANGISFGTSAGSAITASHNALTTARASNDAVGLNTAQSNVTWTVNSAGISFDARGYAGTGTTFNGANVSGSMTVNSVGVQLSLSAAAGGGLTQLTAYAVSNTTQSTSGTIALSTLQFAGAGIASVGITNGSVLISVPAGGGAGDGGVFAGVSDLGNTAGSTGTVSTGNFVLVGTNGLSLSQSTGAAGSAATVTIYQAPPLSDLQLMPALNYRATTVVGPAQNTLYVQPFVVPHDLSASVIMWPVAVTNSSSAASSGQVGFTGKIAIYSQHSTDAKRLTLHSSTSVTLAASYSSNASMMISYFSSVVNSTSFGTSSSSSAGLNVSSLMHGDRFLMVPCGSLSVGNWWIGFAQSTSAAGTAGANLTVNRYAFSSQGNARFGVATSATSNSGMWNNMGLGPWSGNASTIPGSFSFNEILQTGISIFPYQAIGAARRTS